MTLQTLERRQVWLYSAAILAGLALGSGVPELAPLFEAVLWPALGVLLYATFAQVPLTHLPAAFRDVRFMGAVLAGNFVLVPLIAWGLVAFLPPDEPALRLGVLFVLLVPCTDWFITFTHLAGGDTRRAIAVTPINLLMQIALLPIYLWLFMGETFVEILAVERIAVVFVTLIVLPLLAALVTEAWAERRPERELAVERLRWLPVPLLTLAVFLVAASQIEAVVAALPVGARVAGVFVAYLVAAASIGPLLGRLFGLASRPSRALIFSLGTRNSFVVLPLALALPPHWQPAAVVIVFQTLVELFGMMGYLCVVPRWLAPASSTEPKHA